METNNSYKLTVTQKKNGTFDHVVTDPSGKIIGTRNSKKHYTNATVCRWNREQKLISAQAYVAYQAKNPTHYSIEYVTKLLADAQAMIAEDRQHSWGVYSFNSKPTPISSTYAKLYDSFVISETTT